MKYVRLKNGSSVPDLMVSSTMTNLERLLDTDPFGFLEFVMKCRDQNHKIDPASLEAMTDLHLIQSGETVHEMIKNIVLSAVTGEGFDMQLGSPTAD